VGARQEGLFGLPFRCRWRPHGLRLRTDAADRAITLKFATVTAINQAPVVPGLGDQGLQIAHAARTAGNPIVARAGGPAIIRAPASWRSSSVTASKASRISAGSTSRPWTASWRAT